MLSSRDITGKNFNNTTTKLGQRRLSSSSSSSTSSLSSSTDQNHQNPKPKSMEEVWKDINLSSLHDHSHINITNNNKSTNYRNGMILQDFLARPFSRDSPVRFSAGYGSPPPPSATGLNLNSVAPEFQFLGNSYHHRPNLILQPNQHPISNGCSLNDPFGASNGRSFGQKRLPESENNSGDRRHKRMIKNRESAARSRARKQESISSYKLIAYTNELEQEIAHLMEENASLKKQQQLCLAAAAQLPKKHSLYRTSTAPF